MDDELHDPLLGPWLKGWPTAADPVRRSQLGELGWSVLQGHLPLPLAVIRSRALAHNLAWMQRFASERGLDLAPHGKTTMSPGLFRRQLAAGAWGITFATVFQLRLGVRAGVRRAIVANQVQTVPDLDGLARLLETTDGLRVMFLVDSADQLAQIEGWRAARASAPVFDVLLEIGVPGGRTGVRDGAAAIELARALHASAAVRLAGIECYEGLAVSGDSDTDRAAADALMERVNAVASAIDAQGLFDAEEVVVSAGGSAIFDLVAARLRPPLGRPVRGVLRSGCYVTHDHGRYQRLVHQVALRCGCADELQGALEVWTTVQSVPEPGLAILSGGRRDLSFDIELPHVLALARAGRRHVLPADGSWRIRGLNDQHAHLLFDDTGPLAPRVGDLVGLGISHPCTTFDKWHWMPLVDEDYRIVDAVTMHF